MTKAAASQASRRSPKGLRWQGEGGADGGEMEGEGGGLEGGEGFWVVDFDEAKGVVVDADDVGDADVAGGFDGVGHAHGEAVANGEDGEVEGGPFGNEFHVEGEAGVAAVVEIAVGESGRRNRRRRRRSCRRGGCWSAGR